MGWPPSGVPPSQGRAGLSPAPQPGSALPGPPPRLAPPAVQCPAFGSVFTPQPPVAFPTNKTTWKTDG